jgi:hypothetical protein
VKLATSVSFDTLLTSKYSYAYVISFHVTVEVFTDEVGRGVIEKLEDVVLELFCLNREVATKNIPIHTTQIPAIKENIFFIGIPYNYLK